MEELREIRRQATEVGTEIARYAEHGVLRQQARGNVQDEETLTGVLCGQMSAYSQIYGGDARIDLAVVHKVKEERHVGADLMIAFASAIDAWPLRTRLLVQAKRAEPDTRMDAGEWRRMLGQIERMLDLAVESFVMAYSRKAGICVFPALSVAACRSRDLFDLDAYLFPEFIGGLCRGLVGQDSALPPAVIDDGDGWSARHELDIVVRAARGEADAGTGGGADAPLSGSGAAYEFGA